MSYTQSAYVKVFGAADNPSVHYIGEILSTAIDSCFIKRSRKRGTMLSMEVKFQHEADVDLAIRRFHTCLAYGFRWIVVPFQDSRIKQEKDWSDINRVFLNVKRADKNSTPSDGEDNSRRQQRSHRRGHKRQRSSSARRSRSRSPLSASRSSGKGGKKMESNTKHPPVPGKTLSMDYSSFSDFSDAADEENAWGSPKRSDQAPTKDKGLAAGKPNASKPNAQKLNGASRPDASKSNANKPGAGKQDTSVGSRRLALCPTKLQLAESWGQVCLRVPLQSLPSHQQSQIIMKRTNIAMGLLSDCRYITALWSSLKTADEEQNAAYLQVLQSWLNRVTLDYSQQMRDALLQVAPEALAGTGTAATATTL